MIERFKKLALSLNNMNRRKLLKLVGVSSGVAILGIGGKLVYDKATEVTPNDLGLTELSQGVWVPPETDHSELIKKFRDLSLCISDLDDTDAKSPAKKIALEMNHFGLNPEYWAWVAKTGFGRLTKGKSDESKAWKEFVETFLRDQDELDRLQEKLTPDYVKNTLFPGVEEFYSLLPEDMIKIYVTRNIQEVGDAYGNVLGFEEVLAEQFDKEQAIRLISERYPERRRLALKGDSFEDEAILDFLNFRLEKGEIDYALSIYVIESDANDRFDINIRQDYTGLVNLLK